MNKILITGSSGRIGGILLQNLLTAGDYHITALNRKYIKELPKSVEQFTYSEVDKGLSKKLGEFDFVFFCHGVNMGDLNNQIQINSALISNITEALPQIKNARVFYISTRLVYEGHPSEPIDIESNIRPLSPYAISKLIGEEIIKTLFKNYLILRVPSVYSEEALLECWKHSQSTLGLISLFLNQIKSAEEIQLYNDANYIRGYISDKMLAKVIVKSVINCDYKGVVNSPSEINADTFMVAKALANFYNVKIKYLGNLSLENRKYETGNMIWDFKSFETNISNDLVIDGPLSSLL